MQVLILTFLAGASLPAAPSDASQLRRFESSQIHMGTSFAIVLYAPDAAIANRAFHAAFERIGELDRLMSDYVSDSEVIQLSNRSPTPAPVPVSKDLSRVVAAAQALSRRTDGAFDVTVGPLTRLWRRARRRQQLPDADRLAEARASVGYAFMRVDEANQTVHLSRPKMRLDLGGIAKGYATDAALRVLRSHRIERALVNAGGDIAVSGRPPEKSGWIVGIAPLEPMADPSHFLQVENAAVATSGDAWQYVEILGKRYSHILDPHTGIGLTVRSSVSVVAPTGMAADSLASAVSVLGVERGMELIEATPGAAAMILRVEDGKAKTYTSRRLADFER
ncbi:MAG: FAD:protein FMN transferase [Pirellulaceae bacterium]